MSEQKGFIAQEIGQLEYDENRRLVLRMLTAAGAALASGQASALTWQRISTGTTTGNGIDVAAAALSGGVLNSVIVTSGNEAWACGDNAQGQLGQGNTTDLWAPKAMIKGTDNTNLTGVKQVAVGGLAASYDATQYGYSLALTSTGYVWGTGSNNYGQLGVGDRTTRSKLVQMTGISNVTALDVGACHSIMLTGSKTVYAVGWGDDGQLGNGSSGIYSSLTPVQMKDSTNAFVTDAVGIGSGKYHSMVIRGANNVVWVTGDNSNGQLGLGDRTNRNKLTSTGVSNALAVSGGSGFSLILKNDGTIVGSGDNSLGQLGDGGAVTSRSTWGSMTLPRSAIAISGTWNHTLILLDDGTVRACGYGYWGRLGDDNGGVHSQATPVPVLNVSNIVGLGSGDYHSLMLRSDGRIFSVGLNNSGQLGNGTNINLSIATKMIGI